MRTVGVQRWCCSACARQPYRSLAARPRPTRRRRRPRRRPPTAPRAAAGPAACGAPCWSRCWRPFSLQDAHVVRARHSVVIMQPAGRDRVQSQAGRARVVRMLCPRWTDGDAMPIGVG